MRFIGGIIGGLIAGVIGALIWGGIVYASGYEIRIVASLVGILVGIGVALGSRGDTGVETGVLAAVIAVASLIGGKYFTVHLYLSSITAKIERQIHVTDEDGQLYLAERLVAEYEAASKPLKWPPNMDAGNAKKPEDYPKDLWKDAQTRWKGMSPADQGAYRDQVMTRVKDSFHGAVSNATQAGFKASFSVFDALWFLFGIIGAYKLGSGWESDD
jgi:hypothetical protein